jgi:hypothetical protein
MHAAVLILRAETNSQSCRIWGLTQALHSSFGPKLESKTDTCDIENNIRVAGDGRE